MKSFFRKIGSASLVIITYPLFRGLVGTKYEGNGFIDDVKQAWKNP